MAQFSSHSQEPPSRRSSESAGWFYEIDGESTGPVPFRELRDLARDRKLLGHHQVWKAGSDEKQEAANILGLIPPAKKKAAPVPPSDVSDDNPYATPKVRTIWDGPPGGMYLPHLHSANLGVYLSAFLISGVLLFLCRTLTHENTQILLISIAALSITTWVVLTVVYLHRAWTMMHMFGAKLTGGKAISFIIVPFFNALWSFISVSGWAKLWNYNVKHHPGLQPARKVWQIFFVLFPILFLVSQGLVAMHLVTREWPLDFQNSKHLISLGVWGATLLTTVVCWIQIGLSINFLARKKS